MKPTPEFSISTRRLSARKSIFLSAARKGPATVIAKPARRCSTSSPNGNRFTLITAASSSARRSITRRRSGRNWYARLRRAKRAALQRSAYLNDGCEIAPVLLWLAVHGNIAHPQLLDHRAHRSRQIYAGRSAAGIDGRSHGTRDGSTGAR